MEQNNHYALITKHRFSLFALALLWVFFRHTYFYSQFSYGIIIDPLVHIGDCGVDIFMFLSGFGLYYSFTKSPNILLFYKKRIIRIIPTVITLLIIFGITGDLLSGNSISSIFKLSYWINSLYIEYWFIGAILLFYLLFPLIYYLLLPLSSYASSLISISIGVLGIYLVQYLNVPSLNQLEVYFARVPIFIIGAIFAKNNNLFCYKRYIIALLIISIPLLFILPKSFQRLLYTPISIAFITFVPFILNKTPLFFNRLLNKVGKASLEFYLIHVFVFSLGVLLLLKTALNQFLAVLLSLFMVTCASIAYNYFMNKLTAILRNDN